MATNKILLNIFGTRHVDSSLEAAFTSAGAFMATN